MVQLASSPSDYAVDVIAGSVGGILSEVLDYPFDTAKVLLQTSSQQQQQQQQSHPLKSSAVAEPGKSSPCSHTTHARRVSSLLKTTTPTINTKPNSRHYYYTGTIDCLRTSIRERGIGSLYKGLSTRLVGGMFENAAHFMAYASLKREILRYKQQQQQDAGIVQLSNWDYALAGAGSGFVMSFVTTPVELIKCRMQVAAQTKRPRYQNPWDCIRQTVAAEGWKGLYKGHVSTMYREVPGSFFWYLTYELVCEAFRQSLHNSSSEQACVPRNREDLPVLCHLAGGAAAGTMYWTVVFPIDTVKSVLQTQIVVTASSSSMSSSPTPAPTPSTKMALPLCATRAISTLQQISSTSQRNADHNNNSNMSFQHTLQSIYRKGGIRALYRGFGVTILRAAPADAVLFAGYEQTARFLKGF